MGSITQERSRVANAVKYDHPPEAVEAARRDLAAAKLERHIQRVIAAAPPLSAAQRERLALLLHPGTGARDAT